MNNTINMAKPAPRANSYKVIITGNSIMMAKPAPKVTGYRVVETIEYKAIGCHIQAVA